MVSSNIDPDYRAYSDSAIMIDSQSIRLQGDQMGPRIHNNKIMLVRASRTEMEQMVSHGKKARLIRKSITC